MELDRYLIWLVDSLKASLGKLNWLRLFICMIIDNFFLFAN